MFRFNFYDMIFCIIVTVISFVASLVTGMSIAHERQAEDDFSLFFSKQNEYYFLPVPISSESEDRKDTNTLILLRNISCAAFWLSLVLMAVIEIVAANHFL